MRVTIVRNGVRPLQFCWKAASRHVGLGFKIRRTVEIENVMKPVDVTFVIPAKNEQVNIRRCLDSIRGLECDQWKTEIVVVDNGSTDATATIAAEIADVVEVHPGRNVGWLRNRGASVARGQILAFVDADCELAPDWLRRVRSALHDLPDLSAVGNFYDIPPTASWVQRAWHSTKKGLNGPVNFLPAGNFAIRKTTFTKLHGFLEELRSGEDYDLFVRLRGLGGQVFADASIKSLHHEKMSTLRGTVRREYWYGQGMFETARHGVVSRPLVLALAHASLLAVAMFLLVTRQAWSAALIIALLLPCAMAVAACVRVRRFSHLVQLVPIFFAYLIGRLGAIAWYLTTPAARRRANT